MSGSDYLSGLVHRTLGAVPRWHPERRPTFAPRPNPRAGLEIVTPPVVEAPPGEARPAPGPAASSPSPQTREPSPQTREARDTRDELPAQVPRRPQADPKPTLPNPLPPPSAGAMDRFLASRSTARPTPEEIRGDAPGPEVDRRPALAALPPRGGLELRPSPPVLPPSFFRPHTPPPRHDTAPAAPAPRPIDPRALHPIDPPAPRPLDPPAPMLREQQGPPDLPPASPVPVHDPSSAAPVAASSLPAQLRSFRFTRGPLPRPTPPGATRGGALEAATTPGEVPRGEVPRLPQRATTPVDGVRRGAAPERAPDEGPRASSPEPGGPDIHVRIDRIHVTAARPPEPPAPTAPARSPEPSVGLVEHLARRARGAR
jgi:hypothetical protein